MHTQQLLERMYRIRPRRAGPRWHARLARKLKEHITGSTHWLVFGSGVAALWIVAHVYYYNELISLDYDVQTAWAQVEVARQTRDHVRRNLARLLKYYATYEQGLMKDVTKMRTEKESAERSTKSPAQLLAELDAVAEQYPNLRLTDTVQEATRTVVATEIEIAQRIREYNQAVNIYTTTRNQFPGMVFAVVLGFASRDYYTPADTESLSYRELEP